MASGEHKPVSGKADFAPEMIRRGYRDFRPRTAGTTLKETILL